MSLPTITLADVQAHNSKKSCYVTIGTKVYDVTPFLDDHPGGDDLILDYAGKDVSEIMTDTISHEHTESAYEILDDYHIGYLPTATVLDAATNSSHPDDIVPLPPTANGANQLPLKDRKPVFAATGLSSAEDLSKETDFDKDYKTHKFLDLNKPLLKQIWYGGFTKKFYLEQVHRPRHYKGGDSAPLFGNFLEPLTKTSWYIVPIVWLPPVAYGTFVSAVGLRSPISTVFYWTVGLGIWTIVEYALHRFLFHLDE
jgi:4-hydroxysphinganine ceramide fatty acyl 2-hydroxylase